MFVFVMIGHVLARIVCSDAYTESMVMVESKRRRRVECAMTAVSATYGSPGAYVRVALLRTWFELRIYPLSPTAPQSPRLTPTASYLVIVCIFNCES